MPIIDFHTHLDDRWFDKRLMDAESFMTDLDRIGIEVACVFTLMGFYGDCPKHNDALAEQAAAYPNRLLPFLTVDPKRGREAIEELNRCLERKVFRGIKFHPWLQSFAPSMVKPTMVEILQIAAHHALPVIFHDGTPPYATTFQIAQCARWVPEATVVLGHAGLADYTIPAAQLVRDIPNLHACVCGPRPADVRYLIDTAGPEKLLFGSDFGLSDALIIEDRLDAILRAGLSDELTRLILHDNAATLLGLV
jgi:predicted TIM-barrel fold metal-dependent hydrolase